MIFLIHVCMPLLGCLKDTGIMSMVLGCPPSCPVHAARRAAYSWPTTFQLVMLPWRYAGTQDCVKAGHSISSGSILKVHVRTCTCVHVRHG